MKKSTCKLPRCTKETFDKNALFCGEHEREFKSFKDKAGKTTVALLGLATVYVAKKVLDEKINI